MCLSTTDATGIFQCLFGFSPSDRNAMEDEEECDGPGVENLRQTLGVDG